MNIRLWSYNDLQYHIIFFLQINEEGSFKDTIKLVKNLDKGTDRINWYWAYKNMITIIMKNNNASGRFRNGSWWLVRRIFRLRWNGLW